MSPPSSPWIHQLPGAAARPTGEASPQVWVSLSCAGSLCPSFLGKYTEVRKKEEADKALGQCLAPGRMEDMTTGALLVRLVPSAEHQHKGAAGTAVSYA